MQITFHQKAFAMAIGMTILLSGCAELINITTSKPIEMKETTRTLGAKLSDREIETAAKVNIKKADPQLEYAHINVDSFNGIVLLTGQAPSEELRTLAADTVYKLTPVREIHNEIVIADPTNFATRSQDAWISTKVKAQLLPYGYGFSRRGRSYCKHGESHRRCAASGKSV
jgi:osmotically-inducible protein OsmY